MEWMFANQKIFAISMGVILFIACILLIVGCRLFEQWVGDLDQKGGIEDE